MILFGSRSPPIPIAAPIDASRNTKSPTMRKLDPDYLIPFSPLEYQILIALASRPLYGLGVMRQCELDSEGIISPTRGTVYPALKRLERFGYIYAIREEPSQGSKHPRRIYALTPAGKIVFEQETGRLRSAVYLAEAYLSRS